MDIRVGDLVRSFDFSHLREEQGRNACYVEGVVQEIVSASGCNRYKIRCTRRIVAGEVEERDIGKEDVENIAELLKMPSKKIH